MSIRIILEIRDMSQWLHPDYSYYASLKMMNDESILIPLQLTLALLSTSMTNRMNNGLFISDINILIPLFFLLHFLLPFLIFYSTKSEVLANRVTN